MIPSWSPEQWNSISVVGETLIVGGLLFLSLVRGWLVLGRYHREILEGKNTALAELRESAKVDAETMLHQAKTIADRNDVETTVTRLLQSTRDAAAGER